MCPGSDLIKSMVADRTVGRHRMTDGRMWLQSRRQRVGPGRRSAGWLPAAAGGYGRVVSAAGWHAGDRSRGIRPIRSQEGDETLLNQGSGRLDPIRGLDAFQGAGGQPGTMFFGDSSTRYLMEYRIAFFIGIR